ncbi:GMC family oxidoreductase [Burkholderiaceae bacterium FT117]|uniref:GMC oxidoreductase n=1 Tax=Zeimonas sediminis TaxID=2944268 RepID=UPI002342D77F|nr:GMC family oxidoreductase [Zeimonas sediminis]MCM5571732.1 GMC family oxidoreductase [Zeimonas sediminis]
MFAENLEAVSSGGRVFDVCLVGSGPAGITLANELGGRGLSVLLLEAGGGQYDESSQAMFEGEVVGPLKFSLETSRLRYFGGSSNHWGGFCQPLDEVDFETKVPGLDTEWPIRRTDLDPYLARAAEIAELPAAQPETPFGADLRLTHMRYSPPVNFGIKFRPALERLPNVAVALDACVVDMQERGGEIVSLEVSQPDGNRHLVRARRFVLCAGGIENSRLLLWANHRNGGRIVRDARTLGRYWMEHPHFTIGEALLDDSAPFVYDRWSIAWAAPTAAAMRRLGMLNVGLRLTRRNREATRQIIADLACLAPELGRWALAKFRRRLVCGVMLRASWEQAPQPWNRVVLSKDRDRHGVPRAELHWRLSDFDRRTVLSAATLFAEEVLRRNYGRVRLDPWVLGNGTFPADDEVKGNHHMGGTRMSRDPAHGVVDADCRVHGLSNLYVAGSSVFPSAGASNPTFTILQLALRLADHLAERPPAAVARRDRPLAAGIGA